MPHKKPVGICSYCDNEIFKGDELYFKTPVRKVMSKETISILVHKEPVEKCFIPMIEIIFNELKYDIEAVERILNFIFDEKSEGQK